MSPVGYYSLLDPILNGPQHIAHVSFDLAVMKPRYRQAMLLQFLLPCLIALKSLSVALAVDLNDQFQFRTIEMK